MHRVRTTPALSPPAHPLQPIKTTKYDMKKDGSILYLILVFSLVNLIALLFSSQDNRHSRQQAAAEQKSRSLPKPAVTTDVYLPSAMTFAGETVPLHRLDVREALQKELIVNTYLHSHTIQLLKNAPRMFAVIEPILKEAGIPDDFKYLAVIESNLNPSAVSPAKAVGLWQFMEGKSTEAAARYLQKAHDRFGSWTTGAASYNAGTTMLLTQMAIQNESDYYNLLLGEETERYLFRILALKQIMTHPELYNFDIKNTHPIEKTTTVKVQGPIKDWAEFAQEHNISYKTLKRFNPWLRKSSLLNPKHKTYEITIPVHPGDYQ